MGVDPRDFTEMNGELYFSADDGVMEVNYGKQMELKMVRSWLRIFRDGSGSSFPHSFTEF